MVKAFVRDIQRLIEITPTQDCVDEMVRAKVYLDGEYIKTVNQVLIEPESSRVVVNLVNSTVAAADVTVTVLGKNINETEYLDTVHEEITSVAPGAQTIDFDVNDSSYRDLQVTAEEAAGVEVTGITLEKNDRDFDPEGVVVGGLADEKIVVPCDFRGLEPGDNYSIVFEAENIGVIARDLLMLFDKDGFGLGE